MELHNREAEEYLLGACLIDTAVLRDVSEIITRNDFLTTDHALIFDGCLRVLAIHNHVDAVLVAEELKRTGDLGRAGGTSYMYDLIAPVVETESVPFYAKIVKSYSTRRNIISKCNDLCNSAQDINIEIETILSDFQMGAEALVEFQHKATFRTQTALELSQQAFHPVKWIIPDLIPNGLTMLAGPPKIGKSFLCWNFAFAVAMGGVAMSAIAIPQKRNVLYLALDDDAALIQERHAMMLAGELPPDNLHIADAGNTIKFDTIGLSRLGKKVDRENIDLLIVDTLMHVRPDVKESGSKTSYDLDYQSLIPIQQFAHQKNIGILMVTHTRKAIDVDNPFNQIQGSTGIQAGCDSLMMLTKDEGTCKLHVRGRRIPEAEYVLQLLEGGTWKLIDNMENYQMAKATDESYEILAILQEATGPLTPTAIAAELPEIPTNTVRSRLNRMVKRGDIFKIGRGQYTFHCPETEKTFEDIPGFQ